MDVAPRYKTTRRLTLKLADEVPKEFVSIYSHGPLTWPKTLMVDDGHNLKMQWLTFCQSADPGHHRSQAFVESFNRRLAECIFRKQAQEELDSGIDPAIVIHMNKKITRMTGLPPEEAVKKAAQHEA